MMATEETILRQVQAALESEPRVDLHHFPIQVRFADGRLCLDGEVENITARKVALHRAREVVGADEVVDGLRVVPATERSDGEILAGLEQTLLRECDLRSCTLRRGDKGKVEVLHESVGDETCGNILFSVADGVVTLEGHVISLTHRRLVEVLSWWEPGCRRVDNRLRVVPAEEDADHEVSDAVRLALELDPLIHADQIGIATDRGVVTLEGVVPRGLEQRRAELDAWYVAGVREVVNHIEVRP